MELLLQVRRQSVRVAIGDVGDVVVTICLCNNYAPRK